MLTGIKDILIITTPEDQVQFHRLLGDGSKWGINLSYEIQPKPEGLAQAFILAEDFLAGSPSAMILGDNIFFGHGLPEVLTAADKPKCGAIAFGYHVSDPKRYGVIDFDENGRVKGITEKPEFPSSSYAVTGLYFVDETAPERAKLVERSKRGELEITSLLESYLKDGNLSIEKLGRGYAWFDTGTHASLLDAGNFVRTLTERQGLQIGSPDEISYQRKWITKEEITAHSKKFGKNAS